MLPTFVIGLREGLEAALIVGIIAAFLRKQGRRDLLRAVMSGVGIAITICVAAGVALRIYSQELPQKQQEGLETIIGALAVGMVTYMVVWMRRHSRDLKSQLEGLAADAMGSRSGAARAMILMAFLAVFREGIETVVFALAAFNEAHNGTTAGLGLLLGLLVAVALGYGIYRGGVRLNLSKFFRGTGIVLVLVAAGLVVNALHTAHEAGWLDAGQGRTVDLSWLVTPGSVQESLLTGMLGLQPFPVTIEVIGWLVYLIPVGLYVAWPPGRRAPLRGLALGGAVTAVGAGVAALLCFMLAPTAPASRPTLTASTNDGTVRASVAHLRAGSLALTVDGVDGLTQPVRLTATGSAQHAGRAARVYSRAVSGTATGRLPTTLTLGDVAELNGGRLPIGLNNTGVSSVPAAYDDRRVVTVWLDPRTDRIVDLAVRASTTATLQAGARTFVLDAPVRNSAVTLTAVARSAAEAAATHDDAQAQHRSNLRTAAGWLLALAVAALLVSLGAFARLRRAAAPTAGVRPPTPVLAKAQS